jgi:hypothetical protein
MVYNIASPQANALANSLVETFDWKAVAIVNWVNSGSGIRFFFDAI